MKNLLKLHEVIVVVLLSDKKRILTFSQIVEFITMRNLFPERIGNVSLEIQVMLREKKSNARYLYLFEQIDSETIRLRNF
ncbi:MAG: hypothetical protein IPI65_16835 [Bacteroidetes bacterium]|nr:hypothetical protein [Bacteroidota bacterium]